VLKIKLSELLKIIAEEVDSNLQNSAGFSGGGVSIGGPKNIDNSPNTLTNDEEDENEELSLIQNQPGLRSGH
jgi:hypothetical protein